MEKKPGVLPTILVILGILVFSVGTLISYSLFSIQINDFTNLEEDLADFIVSIILVLLLYLIGIVGVVLVILGNIWKQRKLLLILSFFTYLGTIAPIVVVSVWSAQLDGVNNEFLATWGIMLLVVFMHFYGFAYRFEVPEKQKS